MGVVIAGAISENSWTMWFAPTEPGFDLAAIRQVQSGIE
jgi:hypothetical protein